MDSLEALGFMPLWETLCFIVYRKVYGYWPEGFPGVYEN